MRKKKRGEREIRERQGSGVGGAFSNFNENQFIVEGKKNSRDIRLPLSLFLPPSTLLFLFVFHPTHVTQPFKDPEVPMSSSVHHGALPRSSSSGLGGAAEAHTDVQPIAVRRSCLIVCVYTSGCVRARVACMYACMHAGTQASTHAPMCAKHRPHARHSYQGIPFGP